MFKLIPAYKDYLWGGNRLKKEYNKESSYSPLAEAWELSCHPDGLCTIASGEYRGNTLQEYLDIVGKEVLGTLCADFDSFPLLVKFIDAKDNLSVQVYPNDSFALQYEGQCGKTEMWYVCDCQENAILYHGFSKAISEDEFIKRIQDNTLLEVLNAIPVKKGNVFFIEAGEIHAIGAGIVIAEIQQSSNRNCIRCAKKLMRLSIT